MHLFYPGMKEISHLSRPIKWLEITLKYMIRMKSILFFGSGTRNLLQMSAYISNCWIIHSSLFLYLLKTKISIRIKTAVLGKTGLHFPSWLHVHVCIKTKSKNTVGSVSLPLDQRVWSSIF